MGDRFSPPGQGLKSPTQHIPVRPLPLSVSEDLANYRSPLTYLIFSCTCLKLSISAKNFKYKLSGEKVIVQIIIIQLKLLTICYLMLPHMLKDHAGIYKKDLKVCIIM